MKTCIECGKVLDDDFSSCPRCFSYALVDREKLEELEEEVFEEPVEEEEEEEDFEGNGIRDLPEEEEEEETELVTFPVRRRK